MGQPQFMEQTWWDKWVEFGDCWLKKGTHDKDGYTFVRSDGKLRKAHRAVYEALVGPIPRGMDIDHLCRVRDCVNPDHLEPVAHAENVRRGAAGINNAIKTHCLYGHPYTGENTYVDPRGSRRCQTCRKAQRRTTVSVIPDTPLPLA